MVSPQTPIEQLPSWAQLAGVELSNVQCAWVEGKGWGLVPIREAASAFQDSTLLRVPKDLVLSAEAVKDFAKVDQNFRRLLDVVGHESTRKDILLYLFAHLTVQTSGQARQPFARTPWTTYMDFLPRDPIVPTQWSEDERGLLVGTSLETALRAKLESLSEEVDELLQKVSVLDFWSRLWSDRDGCLRQWSLVDAWYRSRCLELPQSGHAMVPFLDMANHSHEPNAYYEENQQGDVLLFLRPGYSLSDGQEMTISYGETKSAAEMLFSYGFVDKHNYKEELTFPLGLFLDDPLAAAKFHVYGGPPTVLLSRSHGKTAWYSPLLHLMCLNEEDGLKFQLLKDPTGGRQIKLFWQDEDVTERAGDFEKMTEDHPLRDIFRLRAVAMLNSLITENLEQNRAAQSGEKFQQEQGEVRRECLEAATIVREIETSILEDAVQDLKEQASLTPNNMLSVILQKTLLFLRESVGLTSRIKLATLLRDEHVAAYLNKGDDESNEALLTSTNEEDDFS